MSIIDVIKSLEDIISTGGVSEQDIIKAEQELNVSFSAEYKTFLAEFGSVLADDVEIVGIAKAKNRNVVEVTKREREFNKEIPKNLYVVENTGIEGIIIWQDENGMIFQSGPNKYPEKISNSLAEYLSSENGNFSL